MFVFRLLSVFPRDSVVGIVGPLRAGQYGRDFSHPSRPALGPTQSPICWVPGHSRG